MQIQRVNNLSVSNNKNNNKQSFGMIKFPTSGAQPTAIIESFEKKGKHAFGIQDGGLFHILKTKFGSFEEQKTISQLNRLDIKVEPIHDFEGEEIIKKTDEHTSEIDDTILNLESFSKKIKDIIKNESYD